MTPMYVKHASITWKNISKRFLNVQMYLILHDTSSLINLGFEFRV
jgi:hypothetical protein